MAGHEQDCDCGQCGAAPPGNVRPGTLSEKFDAMAAAIGDMDPVQFERDVMEAHGVDVAPPHDPVHSPSHYTAGGIEPNDYLRAKLPHEQYVGYLWGQIVKYVSRLGLKGEAVEDARKLAYYAERLVRELEGAAS